MSYAAIARKLGVPKSTLSYWLRELPLEEEEVLAMRRTAWRRGEASREAFRATMRAKRNDEEAKIHKRIEESILPFTKRDMYIAGIMLYIGEGDKRNRYRIALANSDPEVLVFFTRWLIECWSIPREKIRFGLHLYTNMRIAEERKFWQDTLGFGRKSFYKDQVREVKDGFKYEDGDRHGTCTVYVIGSEPKTRLMQAMKVFLKHARVAQW